MRQGKLQLILFAMILLLQAGCKKDTIAVMTGNVTKVLTTTVYISGQLHCTGEGIKKYGHCLSVNPGPTISDIKTEFCSTIGTGEFTSVLYGLEQGTQYYVRGYITSGNDLMYGNEITFTTEKP